MKVLLISPNHRQMTSPRYMQAIQSGIGHLPPLGILSVAGYIKAKSSHKIKVIDALLDNLSAEELSKIIEDENPDVVGIYAITLALLDVLETAEIVRKSAPKAKIVMGGPHPTIFPAESLIFPEIDYAVVGEGEIPFFNLLKYIESGDVGLLPIEGVIGREELLSRQVYPFIHKDLDSLPYPARELTAFQRYYSVVSKHRPSTTIMGSRGCPFHCTFCHTAGGKVFRARGVKSLLGEIKECIGMGIREFFFFDEIFTLDRGRVIEFCKKVIEEKLDIFWDARCRVDLVDEELLRLMRKAGCQRIQYGVESGSPRVLKVLRKGFTPEQAEKAFRWTKRAGISTYADFMIGNPGETMDEIQETLRFALKLAPDYVHYSITMPLPKTELYRQAIERGIIKEDYWTNFAKNPTPDFEIRYWEEILTADQLEEMVKKAYHSFYLRPGYILRSLGRLNSIDEFLIKARAGLKLLNLGRK